MTKKSKQEKVHEWRQRKGNQQRKEKYQYLKAKGIPTETAVTMKFWSWERIFNHLKYR